jgi:hypothetical protein
LRRGRGQGRQANNPVSPMSVTADAEEAEHWRKVLVAGTSCVTDQPQKQMGRKSAELRAVREAIKEHHALWG